MIRIESVRLRNFRSIREAFFRPLETGISVIQGNNGAGKTTLLAGLLFALYGTRPKGSSISNLRRKKSDHTKDECSVSVVFRHMGQDVEVIREIKGASNRVVLNVYVDGKEATVTSVSSGDAWIRQRLGIDEKSFMTAFAVRQKELDSLITATLSERKQIIERLAGIEVINDALKAARKNENDARSTLESLPGSQTAVEEAENQTLLLNSKVEELGSIANNVQNQLNTQGTKEQEAVVLVTELTSLETNLLRGKGQLENLLQQDRQNQDTLYRLRYLDEVNDDEDLDMLRERHKNLTVSINEKRNTYSQSVVKRTNILDRNRELDILKQENGAKLSTVTEALSAVTIEEVFAEREKLEEIVTVCTNEISGLKARESDLRESIRLLGESTDCPTCETHLDDPHALVTRLTNTANTYSEEIIVKQSTVDNSRLQLTVTNDRIIQFDVKDGLERSLELVKQEKEQILKALPVEEYLEELLNEVEKLEIERTTVTEIGQKLSNIGKDRELREELKREVTSAGATIETLRQQIKEWGRKFSDQKLLTAKNDLERLKNSRETLNRSWTQVSSDLASYESRLTIANNNYKSVTEQWKRKSELLKAQETNGLTTALLDKFRRETVASLTPELSENASELISEITSGAYTSINIDDDFNILVMNSAGDTRTIGELSGGEESAVALSLRLAIGLLITGRQPEFLWMDEVLTAQDTDRRSSMLETIRGLPYSQIIMVSHTSDATEIADLTVTVVPDLENGSTLEITSDMTVPMEDVQE